jgi:hypothetical protein
MVPSYHGTSSYLLMTKYNDYADSFAGGTGVNELAVLDPNAAEQDPDCTTMSLPVMKEVLTVVGPTPDLAFRAAGHPNAVKEWCVNSAAVDPWTDSVLANSEDGKLYRWDLTSGRLTQAVTLTPGVGEAYTPTVVGPDGTVYAINDSVLFAVGARPLPSFSVAAASVTVSPRTQAALTFTVSLSAPSPTPLTVDYATADGTARSSVDFTPERGTLTFAPGQTRGFVTVPALGAPAPGPVDAFWLVLSNPGPGARLSAPAAAGTVVFDITSQVTVTRSSLFMNRLNGLAFQTVTLTNNGPAPVFAPVSLVLTGLTPGVSLADLSGLTGAGLPYIEAVPAGVMLGAGRRVTVLLTFSGNLAAGVSYQPRVVAGVGTR